ncbi:MAG: PulJ/GspJ family protein [Candidatus Sumerlaeaceae bacterium]
MMHKILNARRGFTLLETTISLGVLMFIMSFSAYLVFLSGRNVINVRDQVVSQTAAAAASERVVNLLRNAHHFSTVVASPADDPVSNTLKRVEFVRPMLNGTYTTSTIAWDAVRKQLKYFENAADVSYDGNKNPTVSSTPTRVFKNIGSFEVIWQNEYRLQLTFKFQYRGFALYFQNPGNPAFGQMITDVVAKNHFIDKGALNYGDPYTTTPFMLGMAE